MNSREAGFLLLSSHLGNPGRRVLTVAQLRSLGLRVKTMKKPDSDRDMEIMDLLALGYDRETATRILSLLQEENLLNDYCSRGASLGCQPVTRVSDGYPDRLREKLGLDSPGCLWTKGDLSLLQRLGVSLVGSRDLAPKNRTFAEAVGRMAARQGLVLISGNARGADQAAQTACLEAGGQVISIVADELSRHLPRENVLYISEDGFDEPFSAQRALSRNRCIHALGQVTFVAQSSFHKGGTWDGTAKNLRFGWSTVACFDDSSEAVRKLAQMGAYLVRMRDIEEFTL